MATVRRLTRHAISGVESSLGLVSISSSSTGFSSTQINSVLALVDVLRPSKYLVFLACMFPSSFVSYQADLLALPTARSQLDWAA